MKNLCKPKRIIYIMLATFMMISCTKSINEPPEGGDQKQAIKFLVSSANDDLKVASVAAAVPLKDLISQLTLVVYQAETDQEYARVTQLSTNPEFGEFSLNLPLGNYIFVAIGSRSAFDLNQFYQGAMNRILLPFKEANMQYKQPSPSLANKIYRTDDTFVATRMNSITSSSQTITLTMERIVGKLEVVVEDVARYEVDVNNEATGYLFDAKSAFGTIENDNGYIVNNSKGPISVYILRTDKPLLIEISGGGKSRSISVPVYKNKITVVKGKLLAPIATTAFSFVINDKWATDTTFVPL